MTDTIKASNKKALPFDFFLENQFQGEGLPVIFIVNDLIKDGQQAQLHLKIKYDGANNLTFKALEEVGSDSYHIALVFRKGTLHENVSNDFEGKLVSAFEKSRTLYQLGSEVLIHRNEDKALMTETWFLSFKSDVLITTGWTMTLPLEGVVADAGIGSRSTQVATKFANFLHNNTGSPLSFSRAKHLDIINHQGKARVPLHFGVLGSNRLLNTLGEDQVLRLYFETEGRVPLTFGPNTKVSFSIPYNKDKSNLVEFGNAGEVKGIKLSNLDSKKPKSFYSGLDVSNPNFWNSFRASTGEDNDNGHVTYYADNTETENKSYVTGAFEFSNVQISGPDGTAFIHVKVENVPGYWDSDFMIPIYKEASFLTGALELGRTPSERHDSLQSRIDFVSGQKDGEKHKVSLEEYWGLNIYGTQSDDPNQAEPIKIRDADLLIPEGRLSIGHSADEDKPNYPTGRPTNEKLNVKGDASFDGEITANKILLNNSLNEGEVGLKLKYPNNSKKVMSILIGEESDTCSNHAALTLAMADSGSNWPFVIAHKNGQRFGISKEGNIHLHGKIVGELKCDQDIISERRIKDKTGYVMPVGSIIAYAGKTPPVGWLLCNNKPIPSGSKYDELRKLMPNTPNLEGRFLLGKGSGYGWAQEGGAREHKLTIAEMPSHQHHGLGESDSSWPHGTQGGDNDKHKGSKGGTDSDNYYYGTTYAGGNLPHNNMPPFLAMTYIIKY